MLQVGRAIALDAMKIDSAYTQTDSTIEFMLRVYLHSLDSYKVLNTNPQIIRVNVGCYEEKLTTFWNKKTGATDPEGMVTFANKEMKFLFVVPAAETIKTVALSGYFELTSDFDK